MRCVSIAVVGGLIASTGCSCANQSVPVPLVEHPRSVEEHFAESQRHLEKAEIHAQSAEQAEQAPSNFTCTTDPVLDDNLTSGTETISMGWNPCVDTNFFTIDRQRTLEQRELAAAAEHRRRGAALAAAEDANCRGIPPEDLDRSPLSDPSKVQQIIPLRDDDGVRGVRIVLRPDSGLTAAGLHQLIACHGARFMALGKRTTYLGTDPTIVEGVNVTVSETRGQLEVRVESEDTAAALAALGRAQDLTSPQPIEEPAQTARR